jgi:hypothetical protein
VNLCPDDSVYIIFVDKAAVKIILQFLLSGGRPKFVVRVMGEYGFLPSLQKLDIANYDLSMKKRPTNRASAIHGLPHTEGTRNVGNAQNSLLRGVFAGSKVHESLSEIIPLTCIIRPTEKSPIMT